MIRKIVFLVLLLCSFSVPFSVALAAEFSTDSLYQLTSKWKDQNDRQIQLGDFAKQKMLITMTYTGCEHSCPLIISKLTEIQESLEQKIKTKIKIAIVSFNLKKDKPSQLKAYMKKRKLDESSWTFLAGSSASQVRELSVVLGISFKDLGNGDFSHSNIITYLDEQGVPRGKLSSLSESASSFVDKIISDTKKQ